MKALSILVAEDNIINQKLIMTLLTKRGHMPILAENGQEALALLAQNHFDIVLMDLQMPILDGLDATKAIRRAEYGVRWPDIPIIALSAFDTGIDAGKVESSGITAWIRKPFDMAELEAEILRITEQVPFPRQ